MYLYYSPKIIKKIQLPKLDYFIYAFGITLGFYHIDKLKDPDNLLVGEGNTLKHIKITELDSKLKQQIEKWLKQITE